MWSKLHLHSKTQLPPFLHTKNLFWPQRLPQQSTSSSSTLSMGDQRKLSVVLVTSWANLHIVKLYFGGPRTTRVKPMGTRRHPLF
jgi:hypothetical protein